MGSRSIRSPSLLLAVAGCAVALAACGEKQDYVGQASTATPRSTQPTGAGGTTAPTGPSKGTSDADALRDRALDIAFDVLDGKSGKTDPKLVEQAWKQAGIKLVAAAISPPEGALSMQSALGGLPTANDKDVASATNPFTFWFVTKSSDGRCEGGVVFGYPRIERKRSFTSSRLNGAACKGANVDPGEIGL